jgi:hypothetical protein
MQVGKRAAPVLALVDARFGDYLQAVALHEQGSNLLVELTFDSNRALQSVLGARIDLGNQQGQLLIRREASCLYPILVWKPCRESLSPFYPFHMVTVGNHQIFIRVDGQRFTELHDQDRGI